MADIVNMDRFRSEPAASSASGGNGGGIVDDMLKRLSALETSVASITATLPHLATKADLNAVQTEIKSLEVAMIKWIIGTVITMTGVAFAIARFVV